MRVNLNNYICFLVVAVTAVVLLIGGCAKSQEQTAVARVNNYVITVQDLAQEIKYSPYLADSAENLEELLDLAIRREVLIQEAQRRNLDKNKDFMKTIERYWKQTLVKELLQDETGKIYTTGSSDADRELILNKRIEQLYRKAKIKVHKDVLQKIELNKE